MANGPTQEINHNGDDTKKRMARIQQTFAQKAAMERAKPNVGDASIYNIYYDKWYSDGKSKKNGVLDNPALTKCDPELDSGWTRAEEIMRDPFFCVFFAKGCCGNGANCTYLHRIPTSEDEKQFERTRDCFGRERHRLDKDDMSGVGSFERDNRTLYVSRIGAYGNRVRRVIESAFCKFGELESVRCLRSKGIAFVKYKNRLNAEFAKEAMSNQSLEHNETLIVRWATENLNEVSRKALEEEAQEKLLEKLLENPQSVQAKALLHDAMTEAELNEYYQQDTEQYSEYLYKSRQGFDVNLPQPSSEVHHTQPIDSRKRSNSNDLQEAPVKKVSPSALTALAAYESDSD